jgi:hypothetical protein
MKKRESPSWVDMRVSLNRMDVTGLVGLVRDLYKASDLNRRFLHARFAPTESGLEKYRRLVREAVFPNPLSQRPILLRDGTRTIVEYKRATGDLAGTVDLMLEFVEAGTEQAADLGYGDDAYFTALERKVKEVVQLLDALPDADRLLAAERLIKLGEYQDEIGWGYGDFLGTVAANTQARSGHSLKARRRRAG